MKKYWAILITTGLLGYSCSTSTTTSNNTPKPKERTMEEKLSEVAPLIQQHFNTYVDSLPLQIGTTQLEASALLNDLYASNNYFPFWSVYDSTNNQADSLFAVLENSLAYGLPNHFYNVEEIKSLLSRIYTIENIEERLPLIARTDLMLTNAYFLFGTHVAHGFLNPDSLTYEWKIDSMKIDFPNYFVESWKKNEIIEGLEALQPTHYEYQGLQKGLNQFVNAYELSTDTFSIPHFRKDSVKCYNLAKEALLKQNYLTAEDAKDDSLFLKSLMSFQVKHGLNDDAVIGRNSAEALGKSQLHRFQQAAINLERWRWRKPMEDRHIFVNIPAYKLKFADSSEVKHEANVVVGTPWTKTPTFSAKLKYLKVHPYWHVPYSISTGEILPAIKKDNEYLSNRGYQLFDMDRNPVDASTVDWDNVSTSNFKYRVRQNGGWYNSLGLIAFMFPNEHSVFIHDTNAKSFFKSDIRSYSHGCVRLEKPFELADKILRRDENEMNADSVQVFIKRRMEHIVSLKRYIDVHIEYYTAGGDESGNIYFYKDIYSRDGELMQAFKNATAEKSEDVALAQ